MKPTANILRVNPIRPEPESIHAAARVIRQAGVVVFPTHGLYGLGAHALNPVAVQRLFQIKGRSVLNPVLVLIDRMAMLEQVAPPVGAMAHALMHAFWPGQVTFVVRAVAGLPSGLTAGSGKIGVRWTAHPVASALVEAVGAPLTGTSANISGGAGCAAIAMLDPMVRMAADLVLDAGGLAGGPGSTVVDVTDGIPVILREGAVAAERIMACFERFLMERGPRG